MRRAVLACSLLAAFAGCGGGGDSEKPAPTQPASSPATGSGRTPARAADEKLISDWVRTLRRGRTDAAAAYFALPSIVQNASPPVRLTTHNEARAFNESLPCGAVFVRAFRSGPYTIATFRLTERRGPGSENGCNGVGSQAATAFRIRHGKFSEWLRVVPDEDGGSEPEPPQV